jgi:hypothetical protein
LFAVEGEVDPQKSEKIPAPIGKWIGVGWEIILAKLFRDEDPPEDMGGGPESPDRSVREGKRG